MEKKSKSVAPWRAWVKNKIIKLITFFTCIVLILANLFMCSFSPYGIGYRYYENSIQIGVTQQKDLFTLTIDNYLSELEEDGYYICSTEPNNNILYKQGIIHRNEINDEQLQEYIKNSITIEVFAYKLSIENDDTVYYFKSESECNKFVNDLKEYNEKIIITITNEIINMNQITAVKVIQDKVEAYRLDREARDRAAIAKRIKNQNITSRGNNIRVDNPNITQHPLDSYTYISSNFGNRSRGFHTGVDFACPGGTAVLAVKSGTVVTSTALRYSNGNYKSYGESIVIDHGDGTMTLYAHMQSGSRRVSVGSSVSQGQQIGSVGSTGNSTGNHLHFEVWVSGRRTNPVPYLP